MPLINNVEVVDRNNRPPVESKVMLRTYFINDGDFFDPYAISSVHVFNRSENISPNAVLNSEGVVASADTSTAYMVFGPGSKQEGVVGTDSAFDESNYTGQVAPFDPLTHTRCSGVSGIYHLNTGEFAAVLDGTIDLSGVDQNGTEIENTASFATRYIDIWTIKIAQDTDWKTYINNFELFDDAVIVITEPLLLRTKNTLFNKQVILGSRVDLKIGTEITVENQNIDESVKNLFRTSLISNPSVIIKKHNEDSNLPSLVWVSKPGLDQNISITSDNTIVYPFDTVADLSNVENLGSRSGTYSLQVEYNILSEKIVSPQMYFIVK